MGFLDIFKPKKIVRVELDKASPQAINKSLSYENAELKAKLAKFEQQQSQRREAEKDQQEEENVKVVLNEQKKELQLQSQGKILSMKAFWGRYFRDKKFRTKLGFYSFDRSTRLADFGDIGIAEDGDIAILDKDGNMIMRMPEFKQIFQSVSALGNDMGTGKLPIWLDKEGGYIENIMEYEAPELIPTQDGKLRFAKARKRPVYQIIQQLGDEIGEYRSQLSEAEMLITEQQNKIDRLESEGKISEKMAETSRAELQHQEEKVIGIDRVFRQTQRDLVQSRNLYVIQEDALDKLEREIEVMRTKAEREGIKLADEKAFEQINRIRGTIVNEMPDPVQQYQQMPTQNQENEG